MNPEDRNTLYTIAIRAYRQGASLADFERWSRTAFLQASLDMNGGNQTQAARMIGTHRNMFLRTLRRAS